MAFCKDSNIVQIAPRDSSDQATQAMRQAPYILLPGLTNHIHGEGKLALPDLGMLTPDLLQAKST